ncbi:MAG: C40 family peptidase [Pseudoflavonifractor sp.]|nr:C40 family peptidase [Pseudoflavonifractor sp.]
MRIRTILIALLAASSVTVKAASDEAVDTVPAEPWALVNVSVANVRTEPRHGAELSTQALLGTPVRLTAKVGDDWYRTVLPDGYMGYIIGNSLTLKSEAEMARWRDADRVVVITPSEIKAYRDSMTTDCELIVSDLVAGDILERSPRSTSRYVNIIYPDGREAWVPRGEVSDIRAWADTPFNDDIILYYAYSCLGTPYLWGGTSSKGMDCSGLTKLAYYANGLMILRDASQQARTGIPVYNDDYESGDLLFFGDKETGRVNHVGIYIDGGRYIESAGRVRLNELSASPKFLFGRRLRYNVGCPDVLPVSQHPWFFNQP